MAYQRASGTIQKVGRTGKIIQLDDGNWYSAFAASQLRGAREGDAVEFNYVENQQGDKTFLNIKGDVTVDGDAPAPQRTQNARSAPPRQQAAPAQERAPAPREGFVSEQKRQESIQRQVALKCAVDYFSTSGGSVEEVLEAAEAFNNFLAQE